MRGDGPAPPTGTWRLLAALVTATALSQFHRTALGVIGPELADGLAADATFLGAANAVFFLALLVAQVPVGLALDRAGPRPTVAVLTVPAVLGTLGQALATDAAGFLVARFALGLGCGASFMASVVLCARFHAGAGLTTAMARVFAFSQVGILLAGAPFAAAATAIGWRGAYAIAGAATLAAGALWWAWVRDFPPGRAPLRRPAESLAQALRGQVTVWRTPGLLPVLAMHAVGYASMATVLAVWAGPDLAARYGLSPEGRGLVLLMMGFVLSAGLLAVGPIERRLNTRKWLVVGGSAAGIVVLAALALTPTAPLPMTVALLALLCAVTCYPVVVVAHGRSLFPDHLVGRGATTVNLAQVLGSAALPALSGWAVAAAPGGGFSAAYATLAAALALGLVGYLAARDALPRGC